MNNSKFSTHNSQLVSIIMPLYNCEKYIAETINSVLLQTYTNWELLIVDDCSADNSVEIVKKFAEKDTRIKLYEFTNNSGTSNARNKAIKMSKGRYIAFLDSDDIWLPEKLAKQIAFMEETNTALSYTAYTVIDEKSNEKGKFIPPKSLTYSDLLKTCSIGCSTVMYDTNSIGKVYMPNVKKRQDYALWLQILRKTHECKGLDSCLVKYRKYSDSLSSNKLSAAKYQWQIYREVEKLSFLKSCYCFVHYAFYGFIKHRIYYRG
ncbi:MAG: glycosyltransferase family 2 protein [Flavobacteriaceae bacterium]|nr:glycosyltransferase family 2 protein [Flavobacteriaceae bacterium]